MSEPTQLKEPFDHQAFQNLVLYLLIKREGGLVTLQEAEFGQYDLQKIRMGREWTPDGLNVFIIEGD